MADRVLYIALTVSVVGLLLITYVSPSIRPPLSRVCDVGGGSVEKTVRVAGNVSKVHAFRGGSSLLTLSDGGCDIDVYIPYGVSSGLNSSSALGRPVEVSGVVQLYDGRLEVVVDKQSDVAVR